MKVVLDTNVIVAALATQGLCHLLLESVLARHEMVVSPFLLKEVADNLKKKLKMRAARIEVVTRFLKENALLVDDRPVKNLKCRDPNDIKILALAVNAMADAIVTGDQDLLILRSVNGAPILSPRQFWDRMRGD